MEKIFEEIRKERANQDAQWGGPTHDDELDNIVWADCINKQTRKLVQNTYEQEVFEERPFNREYLERVEASEAAQRRALLKVAALAVAALEAMDRKNNSMKAVGT